MTLLESKSQLETHQGQPMAILRDLSDRVIDYKCEDGLYRKTRVILVDGVPHPRHSIISDRWLIHSESRADLMDRDIQLCRQVERFLYNLSDAGLKEYGAVFSAIHERVGLDIFGVDFTIFDGQIIVFEANACMSFLGQQEYGKDGRYQYLEGHIKGLKRAVKKMLMQA